MGLLERIAIILLLAAIGGCAASGGSRSSNKKDDPTRNAAALQVKLGQGYMNQGELETARDKLQRALELDPESVDAHTVMAVLQERIGRYELAETHYRRALELKPDGGAVNNNMGSFVCARGRFDESQPYFERAVRDPFYRTPAVAYANAGFCALKQGDTARAERALRASLELDPRNPSVLYELARIHFTRGDSMRARAFLQRYESVVELPAEALSLAIEIEESAGDSDAANAYREQLQRRFPEYVPAATERSRSP